MFSNDNDYKSAVECAQVYTNREEEKTSIFLILVNLILLGTFAFILYLYFFNSNTIESSTNKSAVLGVSMTAKESAESDREFLKILNSAEVDSISQSSKGNSLNSLNNSMKVLVSESNIQSQTSYTDAISKELQSDDLEEEDTDYQVFLVKKGDTLSSISNKFYGNPNAFKKILDANKNLNKQIYTLPVGETIKVPN